MNIYNKLNPSIVKSIADTAPCPSDYTRKAPPVQATDCTLVFIGGSWVNKPNSAIAAEAKAEKEKEIRERYQAILYSIGEPYMAAERETWKTQEEEALDWSADPDSPCPMIRAMAAVRGIAMEVMVEKILSNAELFRQASGQVLGAQQRELDLLEE